MTITATLQLVVAVNPAASFGKGRDVGPEVAQGLRAAGHDVTMLSEASFDALRGAAAGALATGADALIVVGGDGMVSLGANLVAGTTTPLGIIPSGTGNDVARGLGIPVGNTEAAVRMLLAALGGEPRVIDAGRAVGASGTSTWFVGVLSAGFDALVNERANRLRWPRGPRRYTLAIALELMRFRPIRYRLTIDGVTSAPRGMLAAIANGSSFGGGMLVAPDAEFDDGLFDVFLVAPLSRPAFLRLFPTVFTGQHVTNPAVSIVRARRVRIDADAVVAYADGERLGPLPLDVEVVPGALRVLAPIL